MYKQQQILNDFFSNGIGCVNDPEIFKFVEPIVEKQIYKSKEDSNHCLRAEFNDELVYALDETSNFLFETYLSVIYEQIKIMYYSLWKGLDEHSMEWHNDYCEGTDLSFLCYFNTLTEETGGSLQFRNQENSNDVITFFPKKYDVIICNQNLLWQHRVTPLKTSPLNRTVMNFGYQTEKYDLEGFKSGRYANMK
jgi:hypothetical protein